MHVWTAPIAASGRKLKKYVSVIQETVLLLMVARMNLLYTAQIFASKYRNLYNSVSFDKDEMQHILNELDDKMYYSNCRFTDLDVSIAITKLNAHKKGW